MRQQTLRLRLIYILTLCWVLLACQGSDDGAVRLAVEAPPVEAVQARSGALPLEERLNGVVKARNQVAVRPEVAGPVVEVLVQSGEAVERGQPLVRLDDATVRQQLRQSEANLRLSEASAREARAQVAEIEAQVVRSRSLAAQELISDLDLEMQEAQRAAAEANAEQAEARVDEVRATVEERRAAIAKTLVRSPLTGRVGQRHAEVGMMVDTGTLLFQVGNLEEVVVEIPLTERMLAYVQPGQTTLLTVQGREEAPLRAELSRISPFLDEATFSTVGEIDVDNRDGRLRPGMFVTVDVLYGESDTATLVPVGALWDDPRSGRLGVFVVDGMAAEPPPELSEEAHGVTFREVERLAEGRSVVGLRGVEPEEWVVTVGQHLLAADEVSSARVRPTTWQRVLALQGLQRDDLLRGFLEKQQRLAQTLGAGLPTDEAYLPNTGAPNAGAPNTDKSN